MEGNGVGWEAGCRSICPVGSLVTLAACAKSSSAGYARRRRCSQRMVRKSDWSCQLVAGLWTVSSGSAVAGRTVDLWVTGVQVVQYGHCCCAA